MKIVILCDSKFGNTQALAEAMQAELSADNTVLIQHASDGLTDTTGIDMLLVGGPTHAHGASGPLKKALEVLPHGALQGTQAATFDTRFDGPRLLTGSAATSVVKYLKRAGAEIVAPAESFFVTHDDPPALDPGELDRAAVWVRTIVVEPAYA
jgi:flavodoxin